MIHDLLKLVPLRERLFDKQVQVIEDPSKRKTVRCGRRSGKTNLCATYLLEAAVKARMQFPAEAILTCVYVAITKDHARRLLWPTINQINNNLNIDLHLNNTSLTAEWPKFGIKIWLTGADNIREMEKLRGEAYPLIIVDEAGSFGESFHYFISDVLEHCLADYDGTLVLTGTPNARCAGAFYDADCDIMPGWSHHHWNILSNPMLPRWRGKSDWQDRAKKYLDDECIRKKIDSSDPTFKRETLGEWIKDESALVYRFDKLINIYKHLIASDGFIKILGVDIGWHDSSAFSLVGWNPKEEKPIIYLLHEFSAPRMDTTEIAEKMKWFISEHGVSKIVMDTGGLGKMIAEEIRRRHSVPVIAAEKKDKFSFIEVLNADLRTGRVMLPEGKTADQLYSIQYDDNRIKEDPYYPNDSADSFLYAYREAWHFINTEKPKLIQHGTKEWFDAEEERMKNMRVKHGRI